MEEIKESNSGIFNEDEEKYSKGYRINIDEKHDLVQMEYCGENDEDFSIKLIVQDNKTHKQILDLADLFGDQKIRFESYPRMDMTDFSGTPQFSADLRKRVITMPSGNIFKDPKTLFVLFHELGHIKFHDDLDEKSKARLRNMRQEFKRYHTIKATEAVLNDERKAWVNAIQMARHIKQKYNINLFNLFNNLDDFQVWMRMVGLSSYEIFAKKHGIITEVSKNKLIEKWLSDDTLKLVEDVSQNIASEF